MAHKIDADPQQHQMDNHIPERDYYQSPTSGMVNTQTQCFYCSRILGPSYITVKGFPVVCPPVKFCSVKCLSSFVTIFENLAPR